MGHKLSRRRFLAATGAGTTGLGLGRQSGSTRSVSLGAAGATLALLGGKPVRNEPFPSWPVISANEEKAWMEVLRAKKWNRLGGSYVDRFENIWAKQLGSKYCLATSSGTSALVSAVNALGVGPGDEVLVPPYTFVATINVVLLQYALPVFVDSDRETMQMDANKIERAITKRTRCILPVHIGGSMANLDTILEVGKKHSIPVIEDACQAHLAEWRGRKAGTLGAMGCFSFQASKNLNSAEGGAVMTDNPELYEICKSFQNQGRGAKDSTFSYVRNGDNRRLTEFQGTLLIEQLTRVEEQSRVREQTADYLSKQLSEISGITPARMYEGCTRNAYHLYMLRYDTAAFGGLPRAQFLKAGRAEGVPCSGGYTPLDKEPFLKTTLHSRGYRAIYPEKQIRELEERNRCPENDRLCEEAVWFTQNMLLGGRQDMDQIAEAVRKVQNNATLLARS